MNKRMILGASLAMALVLMPRTSLARWMNGNTGRFHTMDSYEGDQETPQSLHRYTYAQDDPINKVDPSGLKTSVGYRAGGGSSTPGFPFDFGHVLVEVNSEWLDFIPNPTNTAAPGIFRAKVNNTDFPGKYKTRTFTDRTPQQEQKMMQKIVDLKSDPKPWDWNRHCASLSSTVLNLGGFETEGETPVLVWTTLPGNGPVKIIDTPHFGLYVRDLEGWASMYDW